MIGTDAKSASAHFAFLHQRGKLLFNALKLGGVLFVRVFANDKFLGVSVIAGIHTHHLTPFHSLHRGIRLEMNIRHHRHIRTARANASQNVFEIGRVLFSLRGDADNLATHIHQRHGLLNACIRVERAASEHGLLHEGLATAHDHSAVFWITNDHWPRFPPLIAIR